MIFSLYSLAARLQRSSFVQADSSISLIISIFVFSVSRNYVLILLMPDADLSELLLFRYLWVVHEFTKDLSFPLRILYGSVVSF